MKIQKQIFRRRNRSYKADTLSQNLESCSCLQVTELWQQPITRCHRFCIYLYLIFQMVVLFRSNSLITFQIQVYFKRVLVQNKQKIVPLDVYQTNHQSFRKYFVFFFMPYYTKFPGAYFVTRV